MFLEKSKMRQECLVLNLFNDPANNVADKPSLEHDISGMINEQLLKGWRLFTVVNAGNVKLPKNRCGQHLIVVLVREMAGF